MFHLLWKSRKWCNTIEMLIVLWKSRFLNVQKEMSYFGRNLKIGSFGLKIVLWRCFTNGFVRSTCQSDKSLYKAMPLKVRADYGLNSTADFGEAFLNNSLFWLPPHHIFILLLSPHIDGLRICLFLETWKTGLRLCFAIT